MFLPWRQWVSAFTFISVLVLVSGCAPVAPVVLPNVPPPDVQLAKQSAEVMAYNWWSVGYQMKWQEKTDPSWHLDMWVAHQVIAPVLAHHQDAIPLWRFHRRAARDQAGHLFRFKFYASQQIARTVYQALQASEQLLKLQQDGLIVNASYDDLHDLQNPNIEDTSDRNWPLPIQQSWPYFMMGTSQMWLDLIDRVAQQVVAAPQGARLKSLDGFYQIVNQTIIGMWQKEGNHAFLHHLNGLFAYQPLVVYERRLQKF